VTSQGLFPLYLFDARILLVFKEYSHHGLKLVETKRVATSFNAVCHFNPLKTVTLQT